MNHLEETCEALDASVFSSDMMYVPERYAMFKEYLSRWSRAAEEHDKAEMKAATPPAAQPAQERVQTDSLADIGAAYKDIHACLTETLQLSRKQNGHPRQPAQREPLIAFRHGCKWCGELNGCEHRQPAQEPVTWGVDWGKSGDRPCAVIVRRLSAACNEVLAVEFAPYTYNEVKEKNNG